MPTAKTLDFTARGLVSKASAFVSRVLISRAVAGMGRVKVSKPIAVMGRFIVNEPVRAFSGRFRLTQSVALAGRLSLSLAKAGMGRMRVSQATVGMGRFLVKGMTAAYFPAVGTTLAYRTTDGYVRFARVLGSNTTLNTFTIYAPPVSAQDSVDPSILAAVGLGSEGSNGTAWLPGYPIDSSALDDLGSGRITGRT